MRLNGRKKKRTPQVQVKLPGSNNVSYLVFFFVSIDAIALK